MTETEVEVESTKVNSRFGRWVVYWTLFRVHRKFMRAGYTCKVKVHYEPPTITP